MKLIVLSISALIQLALAKPQIADPNVDQGEVSQSNSVVANIIGGQKVTDNIYPWHARIVMKEGFFLSLFQSPTTRCGGALVSKRHVLTAASCSQTNKENLEVRFGNVLRGWMIYESAHDVSKIVTHPNFSNQPRSHDIAVLTLATSPRISRVTKPVSLPVPGTSYVGSTGIVTGFGDTDRRGGTTSQILKQLEVTVIPLDQCFSDPDQSSLGSRHMCAKPVQGPGHGICSGDAGGPLVVKSGDKHVVIGIASFAYNVCAQRPSVYADVAQLLTAEFIKKYLPNVV